MPSSLIGKLSSTNEKSIFLLNTFNLTLKLDSYLECPMENFFVSGIIVVPG